MYGLGLRGCYIGVILVIAMLLKFAGSFKACKKLIKLTRAFVDVRD